MLFSTFVTGRCAAAAIGAGGVDEKRVKTNNNVLYWLYFFLIHWHCAFALCDCD